MTGERKEDKHLRGPGRRPADARGGTGTRRAFRPLRWAWLLLLVALLAPAYDLFLPAGYRPPRVRRTVVIERGQSLHEIARELQRVGVIRSQAGFLVLARAMQLDRSVKAGQYSFRLGISVPALLRALDRGMYGLNLVTVPEGLMVSETAELIERQVGIPAHAIDSLACDPMLLDSLEVGAPSLEGWLAPDSYEWLPGTSPEVVLRTMVARTRERVQRATAGFDSLPLGMNAHEVLTLASIVESESRAKEERPHIARVYLNRLDRGMLLQADPTVGYALGRGPRSRLTFKDLRVESPYNTYRHEGLPPGPICSPGQAAIEAVMNATPGVKDLYFVARGQGRHLFAPTYEQHLANIAFVRGKKAALAALTNPDAASDAEPDSSDGRLAPVRAQAPMTARPAAVLPAPATAPNGAPPLKGTLLLPRSSIRAASSTPPPVTIVPPPAAPAPRGDSTNAVSAQQDAPKPVHVATTEDKPLSAGASRIEATTSSKPAATSVTKPATSTTKPAATSTTKPAATSTTKPAATSTTKPAAASTAKPAAAGTTKRAPATAPSKPTSTGAITPAAKSSAPALAKPPLPKAVADSAKAGKRQKAAGKPAAAGDTPGR